MVSKTHVSGTINDECQADYVFVCIRKENFKVLNIVETSKTYDDRDRPGKKHGANDADD